jgi:hypothetical protein
MMLLPRLTLPLGVALLLVPLPALARGIPDAVRAYEARYTATASATAEEIPSFSRQTGLACNVCHTRFPRLTAFGRQFKLNGYTLVTGRTITSGDSTRRALELNSVPPVSAMAIASVTDVKTDVPFVQNQTVEFPDQLSAFIGSAITPHLGTFLQLTYDAVGGEVGIDNVDVRYANRTHFGSTNVLYGLTLNNNPTSQDVWNSVPAWSFPYASSPVAPTPTAATLIDGGLGQAVAGLGAYALWGGLLYTEFSAYRSAPQGGPNPPDSTSEFTVRNFVPYWRVALQHQMGPHYLMIGTYGIRAQLYPAGVTGTTDTYTDVALDAQYEVAVGGGSIAAHGTWIHERQNLAGSVAAGAALNGTNTLNTVRADASYLPNRWLGFTAGGFSTSGTADASLYGADPITGSASGSPKSGGFIGQIDFMPWLNTRLGIQYVAYTRFNGAKNGYDGAGRNASDNNTLYLFTWMAF